MTFMQCHNARVALASYIAKDALHEAIGCYMYEQWPRVKNLMHDFIIDKIRPFIESGDVENIEIEQYVKQDGYFDIQLQFDIKVIPTQLISYSTKIDIGIDYAQSN